MKNLKICVFFIFFFGHSCALEQASPSDYNDAIYREQVKIKEKINQLALTTDKQKEKEILESLKTQTRTSLERINEIGSFRGDEQLFNAAKILFEFYHEMALNGLDSNNLSSSLDEWRLTMAEEEHKFVKAQARFAETYELFL